MKKIFLVVIGGSCLLLGALLSVIYENSPPPGSALLPLQTKDSIPQNLASPPEKITWKIDDIPHRTLHFSPVGAVSLYGNMTRPTSVSLFISGDGGWDAGVDGMAKTLAQDGQTLVAGINIVQYYKKLHANNSACLYPAGDMENLAEFIQKELHLPDYHKPVLVGYSSGATLVYALLCQAPAGTFRGGIALGFCPEIEIDKPLCEGSGTLEMKRRIKGRGFDFVDQPAPFSPLEVLQGERDAVCDCTSACNFFDQVKQVHVTRLPEAGHGFSVKESWLPQFKTAYNRILSETPQSTGMLLPNGASAVPVAMAAAGYSGRDVQELPLNITSAPVDDKRPLVVFLSGDGGWTGFDQQICGELAAQHYPSLGLNCQSYFWKRKTPEQATADLTPVLRKYLQDWGKTGIILVGYSFGANVAPFVENRLPDDLRSKIKSIVLLSPDTKGDFEIHVAGMLGKSGGPYDVIAEIRSIQNAPVLCVRGEQENTEVQTALQGAAHVQFMHLPGSHHYDNNATKVAAVIETTIK